VLRAGFPGVQAVAEGLLGAFATAGDGLPDEGRELRECAANNTQHLQQWRGPAGTTSWEEIMRKAHHGGQRVR